jgi:hypothetical protein
MQALSTPRRSNLAIRDADAPGCPSTVRSAAPLYSLMVMGSGPIPSDFSIVR